MRIWEINSQPGPSEKGAWIEGLSKNKAKLKYIEYASSNKFVALGFGWVGDFRKYKDDDKLKNAIWNHPTREYNKQKLGKHFNEIKRFRDEVAQEDIILLYHEGFVRIGTVMEKDPYYYVNKGSAEDFIKGAVGYNISPHRIDVDWIDGEPYREVSLAWRGNFREVPKDLISSLRNNELRKILESVASKNLNKIKYVYGILWQEEGQQDLAVNLFKVQESFAKEYTVDNYHETRGLAGQWDKEIHWPTKNNLKLYSQHNSARNFGLHCFRSLKAQSNNSEQKKKFLEIVKMLDSSRTDNVPEIDAEKFSEIIQDYESLTFYQRIEKLRAENKIPKEWKSGDIRPFLGGDFKDNTINSCPHNSCISIDGKIKGNFVKHGAEPKFYRVKEGTFVLIDDPENEEEDEAQDLEYQREIEKASTAELSKGPQKVPQRTDSMNGERWKTNPSIARTVLEKCKYLCDFDNNHKTFTSEITGQNYVEAHHLIPMNLQDMFSYSLDVPANIVSLCPSCHRKFHHATLSERNQIIELFYNKRKSELAIAKISVGLDVLLERYR